MGQSKTAYICLALNFHFVCMPCKIFTGAQKQVQQRTVTHIHTNTHIHTECQGLDLCGALQQAAGLCSNWVY